MTGGGASGDAISGGAVVEDSEEIEGGEGVFEGEVGDTVGDGGDLGDVAGSSTATTRTIMVERLKCDSSI